MRDVAELRGLWLRSVIVWPDGRRDTTTSVRWMQGLNAYIDLRQPQGMPDFSHLRGRDDLSLEDCLWLSRQEGFAGSLSFDGNFFEWSRAIDFQPHSLYSDAGSLHWEGNILVEEGRDVAYYEYWHRDDALATLPTAAVTLLDKDTGTLAAFLRVGDDFMFARDRSVVPSALERLHECVAGATTLTDAQALVDCEISLGRAEESGLTITASTLPYRIGDVLNQQFAGDTLTVADRATNGDSITRDWKITSTEGNTTVLHTTVAFSA